MASKTSKKSVSFINEPEVIEFIKAEFEERKQLFNSRYEIGQMKLDHQRKINALFDKAFKDFKKKEYIQSMTQLRRHMSSVKGSEDDKDAMRQQFMDSITEIIDRDVEDLYKRFNESEHHSSYLSKSKKAGSTSAWSNERLRGGKSKKRTIKNRTKKHKK